MSGTGHHVHFSGKQTRVPGIRFSGHDVRRDCRGLHAHDHGDAYELCLIVSGNVDWWVGREVFQVGPGELYLTRPREQHGGIDSVLQPCELYWCGFVLNNSADIPGFNRSERRTIAKRFAAIKHRHFHANTEVVDAFKRLIDAQNGDDELASAVARTAYLNLLLGTLHCHENHTSEQRLISPAIRRSMRWMADHLENNQSIEAIARQTGLSVAHFHQQFLRETGFTPGDWRTRERIKSAKRLLRQSSYSITQIAMRCGFSSSQYFATAFKRLVGPSPRDYRKG